MQEAIANSVFFEVATKDTCLANFDLTAVKCQYYSHLFAGISVCHVLLSRPLQAVLLASVC